MSCRLRPAALASLLLLASGPGAMALPQGATPVFGQTQVRQPGAGRMEIVQTTPRAGIDWTSFSIGRSESVQVVQPGRSSLLVNRVTGSDPSQILGRLEANGGVWLINPRGIVFGAGSRVDVGSLVATTLDIASDDAAAGRLRLVRGSGTPGAIVADGQIVAEGGTVALVAPQITQRGSIEARRVGLAAASEVTVDVEGDGLIFFNARNDGIAARLEMLGRVSAPGGSVEFRAAARAGFADTVLNLEGVVQARGLGVRDGRIVVDGGAHGITRIAGTLDASSTAAGQTGGDVLVQGDLLLLDTQAVVDASGSAGGGQIRIGGDYLGGNPEVRNASMLTVLAGAQIASDATSAGDGGRVILWSDDATRYFGALSARGGPGGGDGGFAEVSGKAYLDYRGSADLSAPAGRFGTLLLDPANLTIQANDPDLNADGTGVDLTSATLAFSAPAPDTDSVITAGAVISQLLASDVILQANDTITVNAGISTGTNNRTLTLQAGNAIAVNAPISIAGTGGGITLSTNDPDASTRTATGAVTLGSTGALDGTLTATGAISITNNGGSGSHALGQQISAGTLTVNGNATLSSIATVGTLNVASGTLTTSAANRIDNNATVNVSSGATLSLGGNDTVTSLALSGTLSGSGALTAGTYSLTGGTVAGTLGSGAGAGALTSTGNSTITGTANVASATVSSGTLTVGGSGGTLAGPVTVNDSGTLRYTRSGNFSVGNTISGGGTLEHAGSGTLTFTGTSSAGTVQVSSGTLALGAANRIADSVNVSVAGGATLSLNGGDTIGTLSLSGTLSGTGTLTATSYALAGGSVQGALGNGALTSTGTSAIASGGSKGTGTITVSSGTLTIAGTAAAAAVNVNGTSELALGAANRLPDAASVAVASGATFTLTGNETIGTLALSGTLSGTGTLTATTYNLTGGTADADLGTGTVNATGTSAINGSKGAGTLNVNGGTLTLDGITATTTVNVNNTGTLLLGAANRIDNGATVSVGSDATLTLGGNDTISALSLSGTLSGTGTLTATTYTLSGGTVDGALGAGTLTSTGTSTISSTGSKGTGTLVVSGGTLTINGATATETVDVDGGTLALGAADRLPDAADLTVASGATLSLGGNDTIDTLSLSGTLSGSGTLTSSSLTLAGGTVSAAVSTGALASSGSSSIRAAVTATSASVTGGTLTIGNNGAAGSLDVPDVAVAGSATLRFLRTGTVTLPGASGAGTLEKAGSGELQISGSVSTAQVNVTAGTLALNAGSADRLGNATDVSVSTGATLRLDNGSETIDRLDLSGTLSGAATLTAGTYALAGGTANADLGAGTLTSTGTSALNGQAGATSVGVTGGTLTLGNPGRLALGATVTVASGATLALGGNEQVAQLNLSGTLGGSGTLSATAYALSGGTANADLGGGTITSTGSSRIAGTAAALTVDVDGGTLTLGSAGRLAGGASVDIASGATLALGGNETVSQLVVAGTLGGTGTLTAASYALAGGTVSANLGTGTLASTGSSRLDGTAAATTVDVDGGTLTLGAANRLANAAAVTVDSGATLALGGSDTVGSLSLSGTLGGTGTLTAATYALAGGTTNTGANLGAGALASTGASRLNGTAAAGTIDVDGGTLTLGAANRLASGSAVTVDGGATLELLANQTIGSLAGVGTVALGSATLATNATTSSTFAGALTGSGGLTKQGAATTLTLSGSGSTYSGATAVSAGTLRLDGADRLPDGSAVTVAAGATLELGGDDTVGSLVLAGTLAGTGTLTAASYRLDGAAVVADLGAGALTAASGTSTLTGTSSAGTVGVDAGARLDLAAPGRLTGTPAITVSATGTLALGGSESAASITIAGTLAGVGTLTAATYRLDGATVDADLGAGMLTAATGTSTLAGSAAAGTVEVDNGAGLTLDSAGRLTATPAITVDSGGTLTLAGAEAASTLSLAGTLTGSGTLDAGAYTLAAGTVAAGVALGGGTLTVAAGSSTLAGSAAASDLVVQGGGTLALASATRLTAAPAITVQTGGTLALGGDESVATLALSGSLGGTGTLEAASYALTGGSTAQGTALGGGALAVSAGTGTLGGDAAVDSVQVQNGGTLVVTAGRRLTAAPTVTVAAGGELDISSNQTLGSLAGGGTVDLGAATLTTGATGSSTFSGTIRGTGGLVKQGGASTFTLSGANTYSGATRVAAGTLALSGNERLADATRVTVDDGATLRLGGSERVDELRLAGTLAGTGTLDATLGHTLTAATTAAGTSLAGGALVVAPGASTLGGTATVADVTVQGGASLDLGSGGRLTATPAVAVAAGGRLTLGGDESASTLGLSGTLDGTGTLTATTYSMSGGTTAAGAALGVGTLEIDAGTNTLGGTSAAAIVRVADDAILLLGGANRLANGARVEVADRGTLRLGGNDTVRLLDLRGTLDGSGTLTATQGYALAGASTGAGAALGAGALAIDIDAGGASTTMAGTSASTTVEVRDGATLVLATAERLDDLADVTVLAGGTLFLNAAETIGSIELFGTLDGPGQLNAGSYLLNNAVYNSPLGTGRLVSRGASRLNGTSAADEIVVESGTLTLGQAARLTGDADLTVEDGATLRLGGDEAVRTLTLLGTLDNAAGASGTLTASAGYLLDGGDARADLGGVGDLTSRGVSRLGGIAGSRVVDVEAGTLTLGAANRLRNDAAVAVADGATLELGGSDTIASLSLAGTLSGSGTLTASSYAVAGGATASGAHLGTGTLAIGSGTATLGGRSAAGAVDIADGASLVLGAAGRLTGAPSLTVGDGAALTLAGSETLGSLAGSGTVSLGSATLTTGNAANATFDGVIAGSGGLVKQGSGRFTLGGDNTYTGTTRVNAGTLQLGDGGSNGSIASASAIEVSTLLRVVRSDALTLAQAISGRGGIEIAGAGTVTLDGSNKTYSGATRVLSGALRGAGAEALSDASAVTVARGATLATGGDETVRSLDASGAVTLGGDLTAAGRGGVRGDLRFGGAVVAQDGRALTLSAGNLVASAAGNRWGDRLSVDVDGQVTLSAGTAGGAVRDLQIGSLRAGAGGRIRAGALAAVGPLQADGGRLELLASSIDLGGPVRIADATLVAQARTIETSASLEVVDGTLEWVAQQGLALGGVLRLQGSTADLRAESVSMGRVELVDSALEIAAQGNLQFRGAVDSRQSTIVGRGASVVIGDDLTLASGAVTLTATAERALGEPPADELLGLRVEGRQVAFSAAAIDQRGGRIDVAEDARLSLVAERGGSIELDATGNRFAGRIEARSGNAGTAWVNRIEQGFALQDRVVLQGGPVVVGAGGIEADVVDIGADTLATADGGRIVARLPFDNLVGTEASLPGLTLRLGEAAFGIAGSFGRPQGGAIEVSVGSREWGGRTRFPDAGYLTVLPRGGARGSTAVILAGPEVRGGGYQFFFDGAGVLGEIPVFYNNFLPQTPQAVGSISAAVSVTESARRERFEEAVRTENVATRLRAGVIAEVGPGRPATEGAEGAKPPPACAPAGSTLSCAPR